MVAALIKKAKKEFSSQLDTFSLAKLTLHRYTGTKLRPGLELNKLFKQPGYENSDSTPLLITYADNLLPVVKKIKISHHSEERKKRWKELNPKLIEAAAKNEKLEKSAAYSSVTWKLISSIYNIEEYSQPVKEVPLETIEYIQNYLAKAHKSLSGLAQGNDSKRFHFISPILICVVFLFGPNDPVEIVIEEDLTGVNVKANGHFEFMLKRICIVQAKKDDMEQGMAQDLVGMEVASDLNGLDTVYGIVRNYAEWIFLKNHNNRVEKNDVLQREHEIPTVESLKRIAGKIYALLSDD
ncbi:hypothetical protein BDEG_23861 [Batrachochytrium dendrobatidis JEL423]|uniref:Uncharacterized protein n=1 Tax=Batrachochytrium dendrobatidis (strain JEL423) TaxID=403673 RepID=A0A177WK84_BATDL|nr:hypothetical protein BDEG_23861 [Batrachochytrium dendrobatidis JEL423]